MVVHRARRRILRYLERRGAITAVTAPGDSELTVTGDEALGEADPLLARLLGAAVTGLPPAGPARKRAPVRITVATGAAPSAGAAYALRTVASACTLLPAPPPTIGRGASGFAVTCFAHRWPTTTCTSCPSSVQVELKRPWSDGTTAVALAPTALIARLAALVPPPRRHVTRYFGVLSSHCKLRPLVVPPPAEALSACTSETPTEASDGGAGAGRRCRYIPWAELLRRTFAIDVVCSRCGGDLRLIALVKTDDAIRKILTAMGLPAEPPLVHPARPPPEARTPA